MDSAGSRYVDYTSPMAGPSGYRDDGRYSSYDDSYDPPDRPPRRSRNHDRSHDRSIDRLDTRDRNMDRLQRRERSHERLDKRERSMERLDRRNRSLERGIDEGLQINTSLSRPDRRNKSLERGLDKRDRSYEQMDTDASIDRSIDRRNRSMDRLDRRERSIERGLDIRDRSMERSLDRRDRNVDGSIDGRSMDRRHRSRSRDHLSVPYPDQVYLHPGSVGRAPSDRADSEFTVRNETHRSSRAADEEERRAASRAASEIYATTRFPRPHSEMSQYTYRSGRGGSDIMSVKTKTAAGGKLVMETMTAPHPCCPNTRSCCCLMILLNLGLLLITLGFVVVLQLYDPPFVWYVGLSMLIFGFLVLFGSMIYCVFVCREVEKMRPPPGELYWTNHWSKTVHVPEIHYSNNQTRPSDYRGSEFSYKTDRTEPSRLTAGNTNSSMTRY